MQCPFCGQDNDKVVDSRSSEGGKTVRRRRQCLLCHRRFTTYERPEEALRLTVIKKDGTREPYDRSKLVAGLRKACSKRPVGDERLREIVEAVEEDIYRQFDREVPSSFIGDTVSRHLREVDQIAYVRFASVYRNFKDIGELIEEATEVHRTPPVGKDQRPLFEPPAPAPAAAPPAPPTAPRRAGRPRQTPK
jgi:transcriptional repressor NrdR